MNNNLSIYKSKVTFLYYIIFSSIVHFYIFISSMSHKESVQSCIFQLYVKNVLPKCFNFKMLIMRQFPYSTVQREREREIVCRGGEEGSILRLCIYTPAHQLINSMPTQHPDPVHQPMSLEKVFTT